MPDARLADARLMMWDNSHLFLKKTDVDCSLSLIAEIFSRRQLAAGTQPLYFHFAGLIDVFNTALTITIELV